MFRSFPWGSTDCEGIWTGPTGCSRLDGARYFAWKIACIPEQGLDLGGLESGTLVVVRSAKRSNEDADIIAATGKLRGIQVCMHI